MGKTEIDAYLSHLATERKVSASTQPQALNAIIFQYRHVLDQPIEEQIEPTRAKRHPRPPVVMTKAAKGNKDRTTLFPKSIQPEMRHQLEKVKRLHDEDLAQG